MSAVWVAALLALGALALYVGRRPLRWVIGIVLLVLAAIARGIAHAPTRLRHVRRWSGRRAGHVLAWGVAQCSTLASTWRMRSVPTRRTVRGAFRPVRFLTTPVRAVARRAYRRRTGIERLVSGSDAVRAALAAPAEGRITPPLRTVYAERLDTVGLTFVVGENHTAVVRPERRRLRAVLEHREDHIADAIGAAGDLAVALVSASEGRIDAVGGLIVPCCERAMARFASVHDRHAAELFAAGQLLVHRVFLNPPSPAAVSDWYAERAARASAGAFRRILADDTMTDARPDELAGVHDGCPASADAASTEIMLASAIGPHVAWVAGNVLDELLRHRSARGPTSPWGRPRRPDEHRLPADERCAHLVLEAMRHHPVVAGLIRECPHAMDLHDGAEASPTSRLRPLREGVTFVYSRAAEFSRDARGAGGHRVLAFDPERFASQGPPAPPILGFGSGEHACLGQDIALRLIVAILGPLLSRQDVRRDPSRLGLLQHRLRRYSPLRSSGDWRFPTGLYVTFEPGIEA